MTLANGCVIFHQMENIRNFCIIAHIDHGKSTLADRFLEVTGTVEKRKMQPQYLDRLELERERGITIKMAPVRMKYRPTSNPQHQTDSEYILNLIDTPGHSDFSYEVSRALAAVEGAILLVDATKGIQAQTLSNYRSAKKAGLKIIGAVNKIDLQPEHANSVLKSLASLLEVEENEIYKVSGKTGEGVEELLEAVIEKIPPPAQSSSEGGPPESENMNQSLIFDSLYDDHKGILAFIRNYNTTINTNEEVYLLANQSKIKLKEIGTFSPELKPTKSLFPNEMGYLATGLKEPDLIKIGDTVSSNPKTKLLPGYREPGAVVFISFYPTGKTKFEDLKSGFGKLRLSDAALNLEPESNEALGRGLKVGFLGQLHFEIISSRLESEFNLEFITSFPSVAYRIREGSKEYIIKQASDFPIKPDKVFQPMIKIEILTPSQFMSSVMNLKVVFDLEIENVETIGENTIMTGRMPLAELIRDFDDQIKSVSQGFASFSYEITGEEEADVDKMEILVAGEVVPALTRIIPKKDIDREARRTVEKLKDLLPKQQFVQAIQATASSRIIARETLSAMKKDVTGYLYGGDRTRKMKLWKKQQKGKKRLKESGRVEVPLEVFREILKK